MDKIATPLDNIKAMIGAAYALLDDVSYRHKIRAHRDFICPNMRKVAEAIAWQPLPLFFQVKVDPAVKAKLDAALPYGLLRYLSEAKQLRRAPILIRDPHGINGLSTLVSHGKQCRRSWREIVGNLEHRGYGTMGPGKLAQLMKGVQ